MDVGGEWKRVKLEYLVRTQKGFAFKSAWYSEIGRPIVKVSDFTQDSIGTDSLTMIPDEIAERHLRYELKEGDIVIQTVGSWPSNPASVVGKCIRVPHAAHKALLNQNAVRLSPNGDVENRYLYYLLRSPHFGDYIVGTAQGAASQAAITLDSIRAYNFRLPSLITQRKIASILSAYDDLIENNLRRIKILEEMAQALYREWFVKFRFPGHEKVRMVDSPLGKIPEGWEAVPMENVCNRITDGAHLSPKSVDAGYPMASVKDMHNWGVNVYTCRKISEDDYKKLVRNDCKMRKNDVLIAKDGSYLKHCFVVEQDLDVALLSSIAILRPSERIRPHVLAMTLREPDVKTRMKGYVSGAALPRIILKEFRKFTIIVPPIGLQNEWAEDAEPMIKFCWRLLDKNTNLRQTRDLLLPKLISGELDVSDLKIQIPEEAA
jgi:type I restriction enzyme, S subunit